MLFKEKPKNVIDLMRDKEVVYRVTIDKAGVKFETAAKDWSAWYSSSTFEAGMVNYLFSQNDIDGLTELVRCQNLARWMFHDAKLIKEFYKEVRRASNRSVTVTDKQDAEILAEQKVLHEQTAESVMELEKIKKGDKNEN